MQPAAPPACFKLHTMEAAAPASKSAPDVLAQHGIHGVHLLSYGVGGTAIHKLKGIARGAANLAWRIPRKQLQQSVQLDNKCQSAHTAPTFDSSLHSWWHYLVFV